MWTNKPYFVNESVEKYRFISITTITIQKFTPCGIYVDE